MRLKLLSNLVLIVPLLGALASCNQQTCDNTPYCLNPTHAEIQPFGGPSTPGYILVTPGTSQDVEIRIDRLTLPAAEPVYFLPEYAPPPAGTQEDVLASTPEGITVTGSREAFTTATAVVHLNIPAALPHGGYEVQFRVRRLQSTYPETGGSVVLNLRY